MKMPDAMRFVGLDEHRLASKFKRLVSRLGKSKNEKLELETLKECGKLLDAYPTPRQASTGQDPVQIVVDVPRPPRGANEDATVTSPFDPDRNDL